MNFLKSSYQTIKRYLHTLVMVFPYVWKKNPWRLRLRLLLSIFLIGLTIVANILTPMVFGNIVNKLKTYDVANITMLLVSYGIIWASTQALLQLRAILAWKVVRRGIRNLTISLFEHLHSLSSKFHVTRKLGFITANISKIEYSVISVFWNLIFYLFPTIIEIVLIAGIIAFVYNSQYSLILISGVITFLCFTIGCTFYDTKRLKEANEQAGKASNAVLDSLLNYEIVKCFSHEKEEKVKYDIALMQREAAALKSDITFESIFLGQGLIIGATVLAMTLISGLAVVSSKLSIGSFVALNAYMIRITFPLAFLGYVIRDLKNSTANLEETISLFDAKQDLIEDKSADPIIVTKGKIEFKNVGFSYDGKQKTLKNISLTISPGKSVAIVGRSGEGKSTLVKLLLRLYDAEDGSILIDGQDIKQVKLNSLRSAIGIVPQDSNLFNDTVYNNIIYGAQSIEAVTKEDVYAAAKLAHIHDFILNLPQGYDTIVGERGATLSGGEKQRIAIARAVIRKPKIFIFDEATSSLDIHTEQDIHKNLLEISKGHTTLIIAHRLSTIADADEIVVIDKGEIVEIGNHEYLLAQNKDYAKMWKQQSKHKQESEVLLV